MSNNPIGVLDSGVGGISIVQAISKKLPNEDIVFIGDSLHAPYGERTEDDIFVLSRKMVEFLLAWHAKLIVVACNTITVTSLETLRATFPQIPFIGTVPVIKSASEKTKTGKIGVLSTVRTAESAYQKDLIQKFASSYEVSNRGTNRLVPFIERGDITSLAFKKVLHTVLVPFKEEHIDVLVLGCTHYPFIRAEIQDELGKSVLLLDSGDAIARQVDRILRTRNELGQNSKGVTNLFITGNKTTFLKFCEHILKEKREVEVVSL